MAQTNTFKAIDYKFPSRRASDIGQWRQALLASDAGKHKALYDLYEDLLIDGVLSDAYDKRVEAITNAELRFLSDSQDAEKQITNLINTTGFEALLKCIMNTRFFGRAGGEFAFTSGGFQFMEFPAKHVSLETRSILARDTDDIGIPYHDDPFVMVLGERYNKGLFLKTAPLVIYKRGGFGDWSQWVEMFGMPQRVGKYSAHDPGTRLMLEQALSQAGAAPWLVVPKEAEIETNNGGQGGNGSSYNEFRNACNEEVLITILGQTMTTLDGSSRSQSETHKDVEESKNRADRKYVERVLNEVVKPMLEKRGFPASKGRFVFPESIAELSVSDLVQLADIIDIPVGFIRDKYAIPEPNDGEEVARQKSRPAGLMPVQPGDDDNEVEDEDDEDDDETPRPGKKVKLLDRVLNFFVLAPANTGAYPFKHLTLADDVAPSPTDKELIKWVWDKEGRGHFNPDLFNFISGNLIAGLNRGFTSEPLSAPAFDYHRDTAVFKTSLEINLFHFSASKTIAEIQELNRLFRTSTSYADFEKKAAPVVHEFNKVWQRTEYNTAVNTARSTDLYRRLKAQAETFPYWQYVSADDGKVRPQHEKLHGVTLPANDPLWNEIFPPNDWNCRCRVRPLMRHELPPDYSPRGEKVMVASYMNDPSFKKAKAAGWAVNRADTKEVFTKNQMYIRKFPGQAARILDNMTASKWGLQSFNKQKASATASVPVYNGNASEWAAQNSVSNKIIVKDYRSRELQITNKSYKYHTTGSRQSRVAYLDALKETLRNPDEVWINGNPNEYSDMVYVKFFNDEVLIAIGKIRGGSVLECRTWFPLMERREIDQKYRRGLLIKKKSDQ